MKPVPEVWSPVETKEDVLINWGFVANAQFPAFVEPEKGGVILVYPAPFEKKPTTDPDSKSPLTSKFCENPWKQNNEVITNKSLYKKEFNL